MIQSHDTSIAPVWELWPITDVRKTEGENYKKEDETVN